MTSPGRVEVTPSLQTVLAQLAQGQSKITAAIYNLVPALGLVTRKTARVTTGSINGNSDALVTVTWTTPFADTSYSVSALVLDSTAANASLKVVHLETISTTAVAIRVRNDSGGALTGTLHVLAVHD